MSRVYKRQTRDGKQRWYVCVTYNGQRYREIAGDTKKAALKHLRDLETRLEKKGNVAEKKVPFDFLCDEYLRWTEINLAPKTRRERVIAVRAHLKPFFRGLVSDIDVRSIEAYKSLRMAKGISSWTMNGELKVISCILKFGVENKYLEEIPRIRRVKIQKISPRFLSAEEIGKVLAAARPDVRPMLQFMIFTGLRKGEVRFLEWSDVDLQHRLVHVRPKESWSPKTESSARTVPLCDPALEALQMAWARSEKRKAESTLVFPGRKGPLNDIRDSLNGACKRAGVPHIRVHGLRHTFGSQMAMAGADPFAIMKAMGHTDIKTTMIYVSLGKSHIREQVSKLDRITIPPIGPRIISLHGPKESLA
ncbi:MAG: site-specific integrase [Deltaproteobacteria bacterium]|nr:site-specific integrase [Deltaproteobacteria bacterium]